MLLLALLAFQAPHVDSGWSVVVYREITWPPDSAAYTLIIDQPVRDGKAQESWARLRIYTPDDRGFDTKVTPGPLSDVSTEVLNSSLVSDNLSDEPYLYLSPKLRSPSGSPSLLLFGMAQMSDPGSVTVVALNGAGLPYLALNTPALALVAIEDLDADGVAELIGRPSLSQCGGCGHCSYDPYAVYSFPSTGDGPMTYHLLLSQQYNQAHYVWAGSTASERIWVDLCRPGRPRLVTPPPG